MKRKLSLLLCVVVMVMALTPVAFARYEGCTFCGARMTVVDRSDAYDHQYRFIVCSKDSSREDVKHTWKVDLLYQCSNAQCGRESYVDTKTYSEVTCNH